MADDASTIHGFTSWANAGKAAVWLVTTVGAILLWALSAWLDERYAPVALADDVAANASAAAEVKSAVGKVNRQVIDVRAQLLRDRMFDLRVRQCSSPSAGAWFRRELQEVQSDYADVTGERPPELPSCEELR